MADCFVEPLTLPLHECVNPNTLLTPQSDICYAEGNSLSGGACGEWLKFQVHLANKCWPGTLRLHLESCADSYFRATVHVGNFNEERDLSRSAPSCLNDRLANNLYAESIHNNFQWDVCVADDYTYKVRYRVLINGNFLLYVRLDGNDIAGSPFTIFISDGKTSSLSSRVVNGKNLKCRAMPFIKAMVEVLNDERWDFECKNEVAEHYQNKRIMTIENLKKYSFVNELVLNLCDKVGNAVKFQVPNIHAWSTNLGKVVDVKYLGGGTVLIRYVVIVSRDDLERVKRFYLNKDETILPAFLRNLATPCTLNVQINGQNLYGSPFIPEITNMNELEDYYASFPDSYHFLSSKIKKLLAENNIDECPKVLFNFFQQNKSMTEGEKQNVMNQVSKLFEEKSKETKLQNYLIESELYKINHLNKHGLGELHQYIDDQYQILFKSKTSTLLECVNELSSYQSVVDGKVKGFKSLNDLIFNYSKISEELRKLHRHDLADRLYSLIGNMCHKIEINRWDTVFSDRQTKVMKLKAQVDDSMKKMAVFKKKVSERYDHVEFDEVEEGPIHKQVQTVQHQSVTARLLPLVQNRCNPDNSTTEVDRIVETFWRRCSPHDIHSTVSKVLKSTIRLKNAINELFFYYGRGYKAADNTTKHAVTRVGIKQFLIDLNISTTLMKNKKKLDKMFEKFATVKNNELVIPENMWCVYLRELAYLNVLYKIAESGDLTFLRDHFHPTRLSAFYHFCEFHLLALYEKLFMTRPDFHRHLKFYDTSKELKARRNLRNEKEASMLNYFVSKEDLGNYITSEVPAIVGENFSEPLLRVIFKHYSRLSMFGKTELDPKTYKCEDDAWLSTAMFVIFARDFGIVPGYMDGARVQKIAGDTINANIEQGKRNATSSPGRLFYKDFVDSLVNVISNSIHKICVNRDELYTKSLKDNKILNITKKNKFRESRACVQSHESVLEDIKELIEILGFTNRSRICLTIEAIYGTDALDYLH